MDETLIVDVTQIAGMQPAIHNLLLGHLRLVVISHADVAPLEAQFTVFGNACGRAAQRLTDGADVVVLRQ